MATILVTGGAGYIGSHTVIELANAGYEPVIFDNFYNSKPAVLARINKIVGHPIPFVAGDIRSREQLEAVFTNYKIDGVINFSQAPLSVASWFGMFMTFVSFIAVVFIIIRKLIFGDPVDGWASTVCIITLIGGIQLFCMGIMGQYIAKTYMEVKRRPHYIIKESNCTRNKKNNAQN